MKKLSVFMSVVMLWRKQSRSSHCLVLVTVSPPMFWASEIGIVTTLWSEALGR